MLFDSVASLSDWVFEELSYPDRIITVSHCCKLALLEWIFENSAKSVSNPKFNRWQCQWEICVQIIRSSSFHKVMTAQRMMCLMTEVLPLM